MKEINPLKASYHELVDFVMNMLETANREPGREDAAIRTTYYAAITFLAVANRLEETALQLQAAITDAEGRLRDTLQQATRMFLDAADRSQRSADTQAESARRYAQHLTVATWVLAGATLVLGIATCVLVYYTRLMAMKA